MNPRKDPVFMGLVKAACVANACLAYLQGTQKGGYLLSFVALNEDAGAVKALIYMGTGYPNVSYAGQGLKGTDLPEGVRVYPAETTNVAVGDTLKLLDDVYYVDGEDGLPYLDMWARMDEDADRCFGGKRIPQGAVVKVLRLKRGVYTPCVEVDCNGRKLWVVKSYLVQAAVKVGQP